MLLPAGSSEAGDGRERRDGHVLSFLFLQGQSLASRCHIHVMATFAIYLMVCTLMAYFEDSSTCPM